MSRDLTDEDVTLPPTAFTELVGCRIPLQQAGMGGVSTTALAAAVARAGGVGMLAATGSTPTRIVDDIATARTAAGNGVIGVNFLAPFLDLAAFEAAASAVVLVELFYGDPDAGLVRRAHDAGALSSWQVGSAREALAAQDAGCDVIVLQGVEAGGHVRGTEALAPLIETVRPLIEVPLLATGGIGSGEAIAAALRAGADGVRIGTRLLATPESGIHPAYLSALVAAAAGETMLTEAFSRGWPAAPHRVLRSCVEASTELPSLRSPSPPDASFTGDVSCAALYAGTSVADVRHVASAAEVVAELVRDAAAALAGKTPGRPATGRG